MSTLKKVSALNTRDSMSADRSSLRMALLLHQLTTEEYRSLPAKVGRKTVNEGIHAGLHEADSASLRPKCRLTRAGKEY
jgi:hypothetical protein